MKPKPASARACKSSGPWLLALMPNPHDDPAALKALPDDIYRERVLRARGLTVEQRLADVFELSSHQFGMMLAGAMHRLGMRDEDAGWMEVRRWMSRLDRLHEHGLYEKLPQSRSRSLLNRTPHNSIDFHIQ